ncbi:MAG: hypothetical protein O2814_05665 [Bacteroidetes bacterium]|nr:hypothetical protein [Bacteroidota bacterium]
MITRWKNSILERTGPWVWFFLFYAVWGFFTIDDYGVHLDEITQRTIGMENNRFLSGRVGFDKVDEHKFFGPVWESMSYLAEQVVFTEPMRVKLLLRRALLWSFFVFGLWRLYLLGLRNNGWGMVKSTGLSSTVDCGLLDGTQKSRLRWGAMLPVLMVALWPRMFAEAHYNTKDALFFVLVLLVVDGLDKVWRRRIEIQDSVDINGSRQLEEDAHRSKKGMDWGWMGVMGLLGVATTIRMGGVFVLGWATLWPVLQGLNNYIAAVKSPILEKSPSVENASSGFMVFQKRDGVWLISGLFAFAIGYIGSYPYLWFTGLDGLMQVLSFTFNNPWPNGALFFGSMAPSRWYLLGWMITTLSGLILLPLILGGLFAIWRYIKEGFAWQWSTVNFLLILFLSYVVFAFIKMPVMYDAWRHSLFLLLPVVVLATCCWVFVYEKLTPHIKWLELWVFGNGFALVGAVVGIFCPDVVAFLSKQDVKAQNKTELYLESDQTHFNGLGQKLIKRYPMQIDYWHQTNYQALQWIGGQLPSDGSALVIGRGESLMLNTMLLPPPLQGRIHCISSEQLEGGFSLDSLNALWPKVNAQFKPGDSPFVPIKRIYWIDFGDHLQQLTIPVQKSPKCNGVKSWELVQSFYRESLLLVNVYEGL